ncbi:MAG TPA: Hsp20/alpha crystallin family protein [Candidatus Polarisedimenticolaceae bacterium]|nr:Hsp20/alpha crystallin family protein [Candidatus Polarisedimenticolaceae bacterium]
MKKGADWNPLSELLGVQKRMNQLFESALTRSEIEAHDGLGVWIPVCDVYENAGGTLVVGIELPGIDRRSIDVRIDDDELVIEGCREMDREREGEHFHRVERSYGKFSRRFRLPSKIDRESVTAAYKDGVLTVTLARRDGAKPGPIQVSVS